MLSAYDVLFAHVQLPDSLSERKKVLEAFRTVMRPTHPAYATVTAQILTLARLERLQKELPLKFTKAAQ